MKDYEADTLLPLAEIVADASNVVPSDEAVEGYYHENDKLRRYFSLIRAMQNATRPEISEGSAKEALNKLYAVLTSPAIGRIEKTAPHHPLISRVSTPLEEAIESLVHYSPDEIARKAIHFVRCDDVSLVAVACLSGDPIAICAARESVALQIRIVADIERKEIAYEWNVSPSLVLSPA